MDRPILFSAPMVRAILDARKTMTRRIYKPRFDKWQVGDRLWVKETFVEFAKRCAPSGDFDYNNIQIAYRATTPNALEFNNVDFIDDCKWRPSIFMPRRLSRILLELTELKRERLQDISEYDARREGVEDMIYCDLRKIPIGGNIPHSSYRQGFQKIFEDINGKEIWAQNPKVVAIGFKVLEVRNGK